MPASGRSAVAVSSATITAVLELNLNGSEPEGTVIVASSTRTLFRLWLPTVFGASMLVAEIPLVAASAARSAAGGQALAAIGIGVAILVVINTPALAITPLIATEQGRRAQRQLWRHSVAVGLIGSVALLALAVPPGSTGRNALFNLDPALADAVSAFLLGLAPNSFAVAIRRYLHGQLIHARHTAPIIWATLVRIAVTSAVAWIGVALWPGHGPLIAGCALSLGAFLEAAGLAIPAHHRPQPEHQPSMSWTSLTAHHAHLSAARLLTMAPPLITTAGIAHSTNAPESLIVWPVLTAYIALFSSPTTDWEAVTATALREDRHAAAPRRLTAWLAIAVSALLAVTLATGVADSFVRDLMAVPDAPADLGMRWVFLLLPVPALWITRAYLRGRVMADDTTRQLSYASLAHAIVLVATVAALTPTALPGVACASIALLTGMIVEATVIRYPIRNPTAQKHSADAAKT
jgi:hypothetical protein